MRECKPGWYPGAGRALAAVALGVCVIVLRFGPLQARAMVGDGRLTAATTLALSPASTTIQVGQTVSIAINISDIEDLYGADVRLAFNPALLEVQDADSGRSGVQIAPGTAPYPDFPIMNTADNAAGTIWYAVTQTNPREPFSGSGAVATVTFRGLAAGTSALTISYHKLVTRDGDPIAHNAAGGQVIVAVGGATLTATSSPAATATPTATPTPTATNAPVATATNTPTPTRTATATDAVTPTPSLTATPSATTDLTTTATATSTMVYKDTPTPTLTASPTPSLSATPGPTAAATSTPTLTRVTTVTATPSPSVSPTSALGGPLIIDGEVNDDTYINSWDSLRNYGGDGDIRARYAAEGAVERILLRFDLSAIPAGARVNWATLRLCTDGSQLGGLRIGAYGLKRGWQEREASWLLARTGEPWASAGADDPLLDRAAAPVGYTDVRAGERCFEWDITALAQRWVSGPPTGPDDDPALQGITQNHGLLLLPLAGGQACEYGFYSTEYRSIPMVQPHFMIEFELPTPTATPTCTATATETATATATVTLAPTIGILPTTAVITLHLPLTYR